MSMRAAGLASDAPIAPLTSYGTMHRAGRYGMMAMVALVAALLAGVAMVSVASLATAANVYAPLVRKADAVSAAGVAGFATELQVDPVHHVTTANRLEN